MPRLSKAASADIASAFSQWLGGELEHTGSTVSSLVYATRPHVTDSGTELSYSNLKRFLAGTSAPSLRTVLRIVELLSSRPNAPSTTSALMASYPHMIVRLIVGLDMIGLDSYWEIFQTQPQLKRRADRANLQRRLGSDAFKAIHDGEELSQPQSFRVPIPALQSWADALVKHPDLLAISIAYAYFGTLWGDRESDALTAVFQRYEPRREALFAMALQRAQGYDEIKDRHGWEGHYFAERVLANYEIDRMRRFMMVSEPFMHWASVFAEDFITAVPFLRWVDDATLRENIDL
jgi:hypothetical protein